MRLSEFQEYVREFTDQGVVGPLLYGLVLDIVATTVERYPAKVYSPNGVWDEDAETSLCHDFFIERLLGGGWLEHHLLTQQTSEALRHVLRRDFRHFLISRKVRSEYSNLFERAKRILTEDADFAAKGNNKTTYLSAWGLAVWKDKAVVQNPNEVLEAMFSVPLPRLVRYRADSKKYSHLLSKDDLARFLKETMSQLDKWISLDLLMGGLRYRLGLLDTGYISLDEPVAIPGAINPVTYANVVPDPVDVSAEVITKEMAADIFEMLSDRQRHILALHSSIDHPTLEAIGRTIHISKSTVFNELTAIQGLIVADGTTQEEAEKIYLHLSEMSQQ